MLAALIDLKGSLTEATRYMAKLLQVKGTVLPLTEEKVELVGMGENQAFFGEEEVSQNIRYIKKLTYDHDIHIIKEIEEKVKAADLIIFSPGSLYTSILPHLISTELNKILRESSAKLMYVCNLVTQPGETDNYTVSDHVKVLNRYLGTRKIDVVVANNAGVDAHIARRYLDLENKKIVELDTVDARVIQDNIFSIENEKIRHNALKTAYLIFSYLMEEE